MRRRDMLLAPLAGLLATVSRNIQAAWHPLKMSGWRSGACRHLVSPQFFETEPFRIDWATYTTRSRFEEVRPKAPWKWTHSLFTRSTTAPCSRRWMVLNLTTTELMMLDDMERYLREHYPGYVMSSVRSSTVSDATTPGRVEFTHVKQYHHVVTVAEGS